MLLSTPKLSLVSLLVSCLALHAHAHAAIAPALGVQGNPVRADVQRPSAAKPCGSIPVSDIDTSTAVPLGKDGSADFTVTNFNGGTDGSRQVTAQVDPTGTGKSFQAATVTTNGDGDPTNVGSQPLVVQLPAGIQCKGGAAGNLCLMSFKTTSGFGNCAVVSQGAAAAGAVAAPAATATAAASKGGAAKAGDATAATAVAAGASAAKADANDATASTADAAASNKNAGAGKADDAAAAGAAKGDKAEDKGKGKGKDKGKDKGKGKGKGKGKEDKKAKGQAKAAEPAVATATATAAAAAAATPKTASAPAGARAVRSILAASGGESVTKRGLSWIWA